MPAKSKSARIYLTPIAKEIQKKKAARKKSILTDANSKAYPQTKQKQTGKTDLPNKK